MLGASCIPFQAANVEDLKSLIRKHESADVCKWALYVERGPKKEVELRDGLFIQKRFIQHAGPLFPYRGFLFLRSGDAIEDEREQALRDEVETEGTHNIAVRFPGISDSHLDSTIFTVLRE